jgi:four helix bundle protein
MKMAEPIKSYKDLRVFQNAMDAAMKIYKLTATFPPEEKHSLTDQMRRTSRSVCSNLGEAWRNRRSKEDFIAKLNGSEGKASETLVWVEFARRCGYMDGDVCEELDSAYDLILGQLSKMINEPYKWLIKKTAKRQTNEKAPATREETIDA